MPYSNTQQVINLNSIRAKSTQLALFAGNPVSGGVEVNTGAYARQPVTFTSPVSNSQGSYISNSTLINFPQVTSDYNAPLTHWAVYENGSALLVYGTLQELGVDTSRTMRVGDVFRVQASGLVIWDLT